MSVNLANLSIVSWFENVEKHKCGYCKSENSISNGMWAEQLTVEDYQDLIDRGFRRSGKYCYKPIMNRTCCPQYTIRCDAPNFSLSKSQKKVIKKINKFLEDGVLNKKDIPAEGSETFFDDIQEELPRKKQPNISLSDVRSNNIEFDESKLQGDGPKNVETGHGIGEPYHTRTVDMVKNSPRNDTNKDKQKEICSSNRSHKKGIGADTTKPPCKKSKLLRMERKIEKLNKLGLKLDNTRTKMCEPKSIEEFIEIISEGSKFKLKIHLLSCTELQTKSLEEEYTLYKKYQMIVHNDPPEKFSMTRFKRFLVNSPLKHKDFPSGDGSGFGTFHQQYWLDNKLLAVGVLDILPRCVSSVYFFYDPDYASLTLGTYSSLREVYFTRSLQKKVPEITYYYMGFYIHSCPKMRYKGKLAPSFLLCPETYSWIPLKECILLLDVHKYSRLNVDKSAIDMNIPTEDDYLKTQLVYDHQFMSLATFRRISVTSSTLFHQIGLLIGKICLRNLVFWMQ